mmetsp:Transcript_21513/g.60067  ORF Transcript_21513/g.60067 Transcript_21513/m.60067 type:complete len:393 (-) Transcript_21513:1070-2248(-)
MTSTTLLDEDAPWNVDQRDEDPSEKHAKAHEEAKLPQWSEHRGQVGKKGQRSRGRGREGRLARMPVRPREPLFVGLPYARGVLPEVAVDKHDVGAEPDDEEERQERRDRHRRCPRHQREEHETCGYGREHDQQAHGSEQHALRVEHEVEEHDCHRAAREVGVADERLERLEFGDPPTREVDAHPVNGSGPQLRDEILADELCPPCLQPRDNLFQVAWRVEERATKVAETEDASDGGHGSQRLCLERITSLGGPGRFAREEEVDEPMLLRKAEHRREGQHVTPGTIEVHGRRDDVSRLDLQRWKREVCEGEPTFAQWYELLEGIRTHRVPGRQGPQVGLELRNGHEVTYTQKVAPPHGLVHDCEIERREEWKGLQPAALLPAGECQHERVALC